MKMLFALNGWRLQQQQWTTIGRQLCRQLRRQRHNRQLMIAGGDSGHHYSRKQQLRPQSTCISSPTPPSPTNKPFIQCKPSAAAILPKRLNIKNALITEPSGDQLVAISGWIRFVRKQRPVFIHINDGSDRRNLQVVISGKDVIKNLTIKDLHHGCCVRCVGHLMPSPGPKQPTELLCQSLEIVGACDPLEYPFVDKGLTHDTTAAYCRQYPHLRQRLSIYQSLARIRSEAQNAVHMYCKQNDFIQTTAPLITSNDCEGGGHVFSIKSPYCNQDNQYYFDRQTYLTVSSQLHLEAMARSLSRVYTISQCFRAERSLSRRHLAEFLMFEAEEAFVDTVDELMDRVETVCKFIAYYLSNQCTDDFNYLIKETNYEYFDNFLQKRYVRMTYNDAIDVLTKCPKYATTLKSGHNLSAEHERYLVDYSGNVPVFVTHFPANVKPFYMKQSDGKALCFDLLSPISGEICGGSLREDDYKVLDNRLIDLNLKDNFDWYLDLRRFGNTITGGFGIGFDRLIQTLTGIQNIRDVTTFPRYWHNCQL
ncbi:probable asparagine--tRNA ligase, mitochondrial [Oppia nitens]|uniref:probable asparagine--tRNA ligase, mitochondrial n=1 Tax=Oppia nitens TaxID=1686743 RepID=UPI0023DB4FA8|nr:probable asparagine--tRNA ligase, mitochondrial [Oppia nitens]